MKIVLVAPRNPLNIGAAARAMSNFGFTDMRVVNPYEVAFREARSAVGAAQVLIGAGEFATVTEAVADCTLVVGTTSAGRRELKHPLRTLGQGARTIRVQIASGPVALLFGSEKFGLSNEDMSHCHWLMRIPTSDATPSMNLGQAVAVCLYELAGRHVVSPEPARPKPATARDIEELTRMLLEILQRSGYVNPVVEASTEQKSRRLVRRLHITARDAPVWMGMFRQVLWALRRTGE